MNSPESFAELLALSFIPEEVIQEKGDFETSNLDGKNYAPFRPYPKLTAKFIQQQDRRALSYVRLEIGDSAILGWRNITIDGRVTKRRHSHDRNWYERLDGYRPRSVLVLSTMEDVFNAHKYIDLTPNGELDESDGVEADWASLKRVNAGRKEPTIASIASPEMRKFASEVLCAGLANNFRFK